MARTLRLILMTLLVVPLLAACGGGNGGTIEGQVLGLLSKDGASPAPLSGAQVIARGSSGDLPVIQTDGSGKFKFTNVKRDNYNVLVNYGELRSEQKRVAVTDDKKETVSFMLLPADMEIPATPPPLPSGASSSGNAAYFGAGYSPLMWYFLFNQPWVYGYPRAPYTTLDRQVIVIDRTTDPRVPDNNKGYSTYSDPAKPPVAGSKPAPQPVSVPTGSKGEVKPNAAPAAGTSGGTGNTGSAPAAAATPAAPPRSGSSSTGSSGASGVQPTAAAPPRSNQPAAAPTAAAPPRNTQPQPPRPNQPSSPPRPNNPPRH